jgi:uncharacterized protein (DUF2267 family)
MSSVGLRAEEDFAGKNQLEMKITGPFSSDRAPHNKKKKLEMSKDNFHERVA